MAAHPADQAMSAQPRAIAHHLASQRTDIPRQHSNDRPGVVVVHPTIGLVNRPDRVDGAAVVALLDEGERRAPVPIRRPDLAG